MKLAKHYETRLRFLQEVIESGEVGFKYVETSRMLADCMTKPLNPETFAYFRGIMMRESKGLRPNCSSRAVDFYEI